MASRKILVWDLPTRVFHWLLALSFAGAYLTADTERFRDLHVVLGYTMLGLVAFRLLWGLVGTRHARFAAFAFGPRRVVRYLGSLLTPAPEHHVGHNPAGSWAIFALLALALATGASGWATYENLGGDWLEELHEGAASAMLAIVVVHIAGVVVSSVLHRENLARAMLDGRKDGAPGDAIRRRHGLVAAVLLAATLAFWTGGAEKLAAWWAVARPAAHAQS